MHTIRTMGKASKAATAESKKNAEKRAVKRIPKVITDAVVTKIVRKRSGEVRITKAAKKLLKALLIGRGVLYFAKGDAVREKHNMSTMMDTHITLPEQIEAVSDLHFRQFRKKASTFQSLV